MIFPPSQKKHIKIFLHRHVKEDKKESPLKTFFNNPAPLFDA
jgi:hypothetical protein